MEKNIVLIGLSGAGKTTVGKCVAKKLGLDFIDTDILIEEKENKNIEQIFKDEGEKYFRLLEKRLVGKIYERKNTVIATGGGIILNPKNMELLKRTGKVFLLYGSLNSIIDNLKKSSINRPLLKEYDSIYAGLERLWKERKDKYLKSCHYKITIDNKGIDKIANEIINLYNKI